MALVLQDKVSIITGGGRGIGRAIAEVFADEGAKIVIADIIEDIAKEAAESISKKGVDTHYIVVDIADFDAVVRMADEVIERFDRIDVLVNNAGITRDALLLRMRKEDWDAVLSVNLTGAFNCIKSISKYMVKQKQGRIINISSVIGIMGNPGQANYAASKAGMLGLTRAAAKELASRNITVNAIAPGYVYTDLTKNLPDSVIETYLRTIPLKRMGLPIDVAKAAKFLASDDSSYITGQVLQVDGGMIMG